MAPAPKVWGSVDVSLVGSVLAVCGATKKMAQFVSLAMITLSTREQSAANYVANYWLDRDACAGV